MHVQVPTGVEPPSKTPAVLCITETVVVQFTIMAIVGKTTLKILLICPKKIAHPT